MINQCTIIDGTNRGKMGKRLQISFWLNPDSKKHQEVLTILEYYKAKGINLSEIIRRAVRIIYFIDTNNTKALMNELPASLGIGVGMQPALPISQHHRLSEKVEGIEIEEPDADGILSGNVSGRMGGMF
jgi:hypothetical protein